MRIRGRLERSITNEPNTARGTRDRDRDRNPLHRIFMFPSANRTKIAPRAAPLPRPFNVENSFSDEIGQDSALFESK